MAGSPASRPAWLTGLKAILLFLLLTLALLGFAVLSLAAGSIVPLLAVAAVALVLGVLWAGAGAVLRRNRSHREPFWRRWLWASAVWGLLILAVVAVPLLIATYINTARPLAMPRVSLTDGAKEVVFQGMIHIGSPPYYQGVVFDLTQAADLGYVLFFEGVRAGSEENTERMNRLLGTQGLNLNQIYDAFAQQCALKFQNDFFAVFYDNIISDPDQFVNADVSVDDMMAEWERLLAEHPEWRAQQVDARPEDEVDGDLGSWMDRLDNLTPGQRKLTALACHTYLNVNFSQLGGEKPPFKEHVVVEFRNRHLVDMILEHPAERIYVTYGYDHFRGVFRMLQEADPNWRITDVQWRQAIDSAQELERELQLEN